MYSKERNLYPMKRVDFDPNGERNTQNRGISKYERISWDEALDLVVGEFKRVKRDCRPGAIALSHGSQHSWGNIGYYLSALYRFFNAVGFTKVMHNPDSWEGWYWGAMHHWGHSMRLGIGEPFGLVEDCLKNAEMIVFWSSDPETTSGVYGGFEGTQRRMWAKELGIKMVHIDPHCTVASGLRRKRAPTLPWHRRFAMCGSPRICMTRNSSKNARPDSTSGLNTSLAARTARPNPLSGPQRKPA